MAKEPTKKEVEEFYYKLHKENIKSKNHLDALHWIIRDIHHTQETYDVTFKVDWDSFLAENKCPICGETITLGEGEYDCKSCGLTVPAEAYTQAAKQLEKKKIQDSKARQYHAKLLDSGYEPNQILELNHKGRRRALNEVQGGETG